MQVEVKKEKKKRMVQVNLCNNGNEIKRSNVDLLLMQYDFIYHFKQPL